MSGAQDFSMNMSGAATSSLSGMALATNDGAASCDSVGMYAKIKEVRLSGNWYDELVAVAIQDADITIDAGESTTLQVIGVYTGGRTGVIRNSNITFSVGSQSGVTVGANTGVVTGVTAGASAVVSAIITEKPEIVAYANVAVNEA